MAPSLAALIDPGHTAVVTQEAQRGVVGDLAILPELEAAARQRGCHQHWAAIAAAARGAGVPIVHCVAARRGDGAGSNRNARLFVALAKLARLQPGTGDVEVVPELGPDPADVTLTRLHGVGPMGNTDLDAVLRNMGVTTIVGIGVSVNVGMLDLCFDAVNAGYQVVIPRDAVAGVPADYAEAVIDNSMALVATVTTTAEVVATWA